MQININKDVTDVLKQINGHKHLFKGQFGLEKEMLRTMSDGKLATTKHPEVFGKKDYNKMITTDFSEQQLELITPPCESIQEAYNYMYDITSIVENSIDELLWPHSMPNILPAVEDIQYAKFETKKDSEYYRKYLSKKYGPTKQMISGIHFNFSFSEKYIKNLHKQINPDEDYADFKDHLYSKVGRIFLQHRFLFIYLFNNTNVFHETFNIDNKTPDVINKETSTLPNLLSTRTSEHGYTNLKNYIIDYSSFPSFRASIDKLIREGELIDKRELYDLMRYKSFDNEHIEYIEMRNLDLNLEDINGVDVKQMKFIHLFLTLASTMQDFEYSEAYQNETYANVKAINYGNHKEDILVKVSGEESTFVDYATDILDAMQEFAKMFEHPDEDIFQIVEEQRVRIVEKNPLCNDFYHKAIEKGFIQANLEIAEQRKKYFREHNYHSPAFSDLELSTQILIKEAIKQGIDFEILDRTGNFVEFTKNGNAQLVKQATKTQADEYASVLAMDNKAITKKILHRNGINVPLGEVYTSIDDAWDDFERHEHKSIVIKPNETNFGIGIHIVENNNNFDLYKEMVTESFNHDQKILIEEFIPGNEYRIFVINGKVAASLNRQPANVVGDGINSITNLVIEKNKHIWRGENYTKPLQKIKLGEVERLHLAASGLDFDFVPAHGEKVFLRENSNVSTGGDSVDFTKAMAPEYQQIAINAAKCFNAAICGVDMMIPDLTKYNDDYAIIELNWNPAIHMHRFPAIGEPQHIAPEIFELIFKDK